MSTRLYSNCWPQTSLTRSRSILRYGTSKLFDTAAQKNKYQGAHMTKTKLFNHIHEFCVYSCDLKTNQTYYIGVGNSTIISICFFFRCCWKSKKIILSRPFLHLLFLCHSFAVVLLFFKLFIPFLHLSLEHYIFLGI